MGIEDDLFGMFKFLDLGKGKQLDEMLAILTRSIQINTLKKLRSEIDKLIKQLQASSSAGGLDPYSILGVSSTATKEEIEKAFREKAWNSHPDHGGSNEEMIMVNAAMEAIRRLRGWNK